MSDISAISASHKLTTQLKVSLETKQPQINAPTEIKEIKQFEMEMARAVTLANEIRASLEASLRQLSE
jgi:hypothetical protein